MVPLETIASHLKEGYFLADDMETLGLEGNVSLPAMKDALARRLVPLTVVSLTADVMAQANAERAAAATAAAQVEAQQEADRTALIASIQAKQDADKQAVQDAAEVEAARERFLAALQTGNNAQTS